MDDLERRLRKTLTSVAHAPNWSPHDQVPLDEITCAAGELRLARRRMLWLLGAGAVLIVLLFLS